ncbi:riboflavin synthase [Auraticoccus sp. F435]|uniref:Riboflavin synthase n=1 Tax=Auraticoccus cholistanensis TaxID=2656650 RepID=A0A6A9V0U5_9ACTN|nr:riboflavin synthase [Auraticoccus cholistanensis]MVA76259.1 riboflavin synthase [Auraticoccus cholistanensis]
MFTGIIEELGHVVALSWRGDSAVLTVSGPRVVEDAVHGASIAVNGVCLTVTDADAATGQVRFDVMAETLRRSNLGRLTAGDRVNLERAVGVADRLGGHIVQGHVDGTAELLSRVPGERWEVVRFGLPQELAGYVVQKGSVAVDGVSLTVSGVAPDAFEVSLIPTTLALTTLGTRRPGEQVNLEVDVLAKYVERLLQTGSASPAEVLR